MKLLEKICPLKVTKSKNFPKVRVVFNFLTCEQPVPNFPIFKSTAVSILKISHPSECLGIPIQFSRVRIWGGRKQHSLQER